MKKVVVITGPTGIGKTEISIQVAKRINAEIISADSAQVYKGLNIGTAKIKDEEKQGIPHHLIDILEPSETFDVSNYQKEARKLIDKLEKPLIVGGTGFYIKATLDDYDFSDEPRDKLFEEQFKNHSNEELFNLLKEKDLEASEKVHPNNRRRVLRLLSNEGKQKTGKNDPVYDYIVFQLQMPRKTLYKRINERVDIMLEEGVLKEVKDLKKEGYTFNIICYKELNEYLDGKTTYEEAVSNVKKVTRRYAKRQETWFNNQMNTIKVDALNKEVAIEVITKEIKEFYKEP